jgi:hypothetical protein
MSLKLERYGDSVHVMTNDHVQIEEESASEIIRVRSL